MTFTDGGTTYTATVAATSAGSTPFSADKSARVLLEPKVKVGKDETTWEKSKLAPNVDLTWTNGAKAPEVDGGYVGGWYGTTVFTFVLDASRPADGNLLRIGNLKMSKVYFGITNEPVPVD